MPNNRALLVYACKVLLNRYSASPDEMVKAGEQFRRDHAEINQEHGRNLEREEYALALLHALAGQYFMHRANPGAQTCPNSRMFPLN